jgi:hypothetical protein
MHGTILVQTTVCVIDIKRVGSFEYEYAARRFVRHRQDPAYRHIHGGKGRVHRPAV